MSSKSVEKKYNYFLDYESFEDHSSDLKDIIIPFSEFGTSKKPKYLYNGLEEIPFKKRHPDYQKILLNEFVEEISES